MSVIEALRLVTPERDDKALTIDLANSDSINLASIDSRPGRFEFHTRVEDLDLLASGNIATSNPSVSASHASLLVVAGHRNGGMAGAEHEDLREALERRLWKAADGKT